jgi:uncharacterized protein (TIGR02147 family)
MEIQNTDLRSEKIRFFTIKRPFDSPIPREIDPMTVFEFDDFRAYLNHIRSHYPGMKRPITLERWAKKLQYRSPRSIAMVLKGQRLPSEDLVLAFSKDLSHSENERRYFELLVRKEKYRGNVPKLVLDELQKLNPKLIHRKALDAEVFSYVSGWQNYVILQLFSVPSYFSVKPENFVKWLHKRIGEKISIEDVEASLSLLERLKFIEKSEDGKYQLAAATDPLIAIEEIPSAAGRRHHCEQMDQAKEALQRAPMQEREFTCLTFQAKRSKMAEIKKAIREFRDKFDKDFYDAEGEDVCQLNMQFFFHTKEEKK